MLSIRYRYCLSATVTLLFALGLCGISLPQDASDLRLVPFPKQVQINSAERFSLKVPLTLHVPAKNKDALATPLLSEMKRVGFPEPQLVECDSDTLRVTLATTGTALTDPKLPEQAGEGKSDVAESYALTISPQGIVCVGKGDIGLFYAVQTLQQFIRANADANGTLPCLTIQDWPSMKYRCFQDDWTRGPSPHLEMIFNYFDLGSQLKHNMFTYYMEDQFEFKKHPLIGPKDGILTQEEFKKAIEYAAKKHLIILGTQQSFGHHYKILSIPEYAHLAEPGYSGSPFGSNTPYILSPVVEEVYSFLDDLYSEVIPLLPFEMFFVACDETWDLAKSGPSKELADEIGVGGVYVKHLLRVYDLLKKYDKRMMMSGDIIVDHPDRLHELPKDIVMMCWWYEPLPDFDSYIKPFSESGFEFFICPGQANWSVMLPLIYKYKVNIQNFVRDGCKHGTLGMVNTGWEDDGEAIHGYNWHAIAWGAECSWNASKTDYDDFNKRIGAVLFGAEGDDFCKAIDLLDELQTAPELGSSFNSRFWERDFLPRESPKGVERKAKRILELVRPAIAHLKTTKEQAIINAELLDSYLFGAGRMELIAERMLAGLELVNLYTTATSLDLSDPVQQEVAITKLENMESIVTKVREKHRAVEKEFVRIWNSESKPFSLNHVMKKYDDLDKWFAVIENRIKDVRQKTLAGQIDTTLPDIGLSDGIMARKTMPTSVVASPLSPESAWMVPESSVRLGLTVDAGNADRSHLPVELEVSIPEPIREKGIAAFLLPTDGKNAIPISGQTSPIAEKSTRHLTLIIPELQKETTAKIHVYFGLDHAPTSHQKVSVFDGEDGMKVIENDFVKIHLVPEGGHAHQWIVKGYEGERSITDPCGTSYLGFCDPGHTERTRKFDLVCMNHGPAMVRYGCFCDGELYKTLTVYAGLPMIDVIVTSPVGYYWDFGEPENFAADGQTPGTFLFSNGRTGPTALKGESNDLQTRESSVFWAVKTNEKGLTHGLTTPEALSRFVVGPGGPMGSVGIETGEARSHFVTYAGTPNGRSAHDIMEAIRSTFDLRNQPKITLYEKEKRKEFTEFTTAHNLER